MVAYELTLRHRHLARVRTDGVSISGFLIGPGMGADGDREVAALVVERGVREVGGKNDGHSAYHRTDGAAHGACDNENRSGAARATLADLGGDPLPAKEALLTEIVVEHLRELDAGVAQDVVVYVLCH